MKHIRITAALLLILGSLCIQSCTAKASQPEPPQSSAAEQTTAPPQQAAESAAFEANGIRFSAAGGFYDAPFLLTLSADSSAAIYYTLDGSIPTADSTRYTEPIPVSDRSAEPNRISMHGDMVPENAEMPAPLPEAPVDKATVLRVIAVDENGVQSPVISNTYFVGFKEKAEYYQTLKVISVMADEDDLFDSERGIFVRGKTYEDWKNSADYDPETPDYRTPGNYTQKGKEWERQAAVQIFENGQAAASLEGGIRVHGGATRSYPQKSINVYARREYGAAKLEYDLFSGAVSSEATGKPITEFHAFLLRNGGNDAMYTRIRDNLNQSLCADRSFLTQCMEPCIVFLNGEYWGQYDITERVDASMIKAHYGIPKKQVCIIKKEALDEGSEDTFTEWQALRQWIQETDFSDDAAYESLCSRIDMQSFSDYISSEIYINNANWDRSNMAMWKAEVTDESNPYADGKWRFIMFDTDFSTGIYGTALPTDDSFAKLLESDCFLSDLFRGALENEAFRQSFAETFRTIAGENFDAAHVNAEIDALADRYRAPANDTFNRFWGGLGLDFDGELQTVRRFYQKRGEAILGYLEKYTASAPPEKEKTTGST